MAALLAARLLTCSRQIVPKSLTMSSRLLSTTTSLARSPRISTVSLLSHPNRSSSITTPPFSFMQTAIDTPASIRMFTVPAVFRNHSRRGPLSRRPGRRGAKLLSKIKVCRQYEWTKSLVQESRNGLMSVNHFFIIIVISCDTLIELS